MHPRFGISQSIPRQGGRRAAARTRPLCGGHAPPGTLHGVVLRSPHAHARFRIADAATARGMRGVHLVLTAADVAELGPLPCVAVPEGVTINAPPYPILAREEVRHVGDAVAFMVADTIERPGMRRKQSPSSGRRCPTWLTPSRR